jgi:hypothetical protein
MLNKVEIAIKIILLLLINFLNIILMLNSNYLAASIVCSFCILKALFIVSVYFLGTQMIRQVKWYITDEKTTIITNLFHSWNSG